MDNYIHEYSLIKTDVINKAIYKAASTKQAYFTIQDIISILNELNRELAPAVDIVSESYLEGWKEACTIMTDKGGFWEPRSKYLGQPYNHQSYNNQPKEV